MDNSILYKKFSIGLSLGESISEIDDLLNEYDKWINSIYFSAPLGRKFYSRAKLAEEYDGNEDKLLTVLRHIKEHQIRLELTLNTRDLTDDELASAVLFFRDNGLNPEEIVCLKGYAGFLRRFAPGARSNTASIIMILTFNTQMIILIMWLSGRRCFASVKKYCF